MRRHSRCTRQIDTESLLYTTIENTRTHGHASRNASTSALATGIYLFKSDVRSLL